MFFYSRLAVETGVFSARSAPEPGGRRPNALLMVVFYKYVGKIFFDYFMRSKW